MTARLALLARRRALLVEAAERQRASVAAIARPWSRPGERLGAVLKAHPLLIAGSVALVVALRPRRIGRWLAKGWMAWRTLQSYTAAKKNRPIL